ncbi:MAG: glycoside hydrolase family 65 protein [Candidatus Omnitrophica bacterium]|nr:glycoside hydrolase family 65 protein [Candidatus Omnitrophota bacterium]
MKDIYLPFIHDELWLVKETGFFSDLQAIRETQFSLGNGYMGIRGIYEEIPYDCKPGTYLAGVYDKMTSQVSELVNMPNPVYFKFTIEGEKLSLISMDMLEHKRILNMKKAVLARKTIYKDRKGRRYNYQSLRFLSLADKNIGAMQIMLTPLDSGCTLDVNTTIDTSVSNAGLLSEGRKRHFRIKELGEQNGFKYLIINTFEKKRTIIYWSRFYYQLGLKKIYKQDDIFRLKLKKGQSVVFTKIFYIKHFSYKENPAKEKKETHYAYKKAFNRSFSGLLNDHIYAWGNLWSKADMEIQGTERIQKNIRFNIFHMLICANFDGGFSSVGARTLSGEGYRGHVFWDAEIFLLPFYLYTIPEIAKNMLIYRYNRLNASREYARSNGFKGAQFVWESADTGREETPSWARNIDRSIIKIHTHEMEHHITADIAYAVYKYYLVTKDEKFMLDYGYELLIETARFWVSRIEYGKKKKRYQIKKVIGPDEFHINVNNNAFTNVMAKFNLLTACRMIRSLKKKPEQFSRIKRKLNIKDNEPRQWKEIASRFDLAVNKDKIIEQFDGYFKLKEVELTKTDENGIPLIPAKIKAKDLEKTQLVKQADVLMLLYLLNDVYGKELKKKNYDFYISRTVHKSSLSAPIHAAFAVEVQDLHKAYNFFNLALHTDISNVYGNTPDGIHAASLGGTWQAVVFGFAGVKLKKEILHIEPCMPRLWRKLKFNLCLQSCFFNLDLTNDDVFVKFSSKNTRSFKVCIFGKARSLSRRKKYHFKRSSAKGRSEEYY